MKIKQNQSLNETNNINQMSTSTPVKTGDTTFVDGKSMMQVSSLRAACGQKLHFVFKGENPKPLAEKVADFFSRLD